jgi:hypothetical protein
MFIVMSDRDRLIIRLKNLLAIHKAKQEKWQAENKLRPDVGCLTREACIITCLYPQMRQLGVTFNDVANYNPIDKSTSSC